MLRQIHNSQLSLAVPQWTHIFTHCCTRSSDFMSSAFHFLRAISALPLAVIAMINRAVLIIHVFIAQRGVIRMSL